jgi:hypothetical protein
MHYGQQLKFIVAIERLAFDTLKHNAVIGVKYKELISIRRISYLRLIRMNIDRLSKRRHNIKGLAEDNNEDRR